jgi:hypothetical protein
MLDLPRASRIAENCIRKTAGLYPPSKYPIDPSDVLLTLGINNNGNNNNRIDQLSNYIANSTEIGLPSLTPINLSGS